MRSLQNRRGKPAIGLPGVLAALAFLVSACDSGGGDTAPTVSSVSVNPQYVSLTRGASTTFSAAVSGSNNPDQKVVWSVEGNSDLNTKFPNANKGDLQLGSEENNAVLTIRAVSLADPKFSHTAVVAVQTGGTVSPITVSPAYALVNPGGERQFSATPNDVTWTLGGNEKGSIISESGFLEVAADETATLLRVVATSKAEPAKSGIALVAVGATAYSVTFNANGGTFYATGRTDAITQYVLPDHTASQPAVSRTNYELDARTQNSGWYTDPTFQNLWNFSTPVTRDLTLYAKWKPVTYRIFYMKDSSTEFQTTSELPSSAPVSFDLVSGRSYTLPTFLNGYTFDGWYASSDLTGNPVTTFTPSQPEDKRFYAKLRYRQSVNLTYSVSTENLTIAGAGDATTVASTGTLTISPSGTGYSGQQWYVNGVHDEDNDGETTYEFSGADRDTASVYTIGLLVQKDGLYYYAETRVSVTP
ncbi:MAG: InlB B-repeat-containing protein [Spirochaetaceae bacterium]|jgi:uncharacterized repeat protein (TIGR02543 family)|nr:InlB B-repeat-containing protein [Spirochaetaceae bacterium]